MSERLSEQALSMVKDAANALMDGASFDPAASAINGALIDLALTELRARRAADLTAEEMEALGVLFAFVYREVAMTEKEMAALKPGLDVIHKLLASGGGK